MLTHNLPEPVRKLIRALSQIPTLGPRQATRIALWLVNQDHGLGAELAQNLTDLATVRTCARCYFLHQNDGGLCAICANPNRVQNIILLVEKETDLISLEQTGKFTGRYFLLGPISKLGTLEDWQKTRLEQLKQQIAKEFGGQAAEIILGLNPTSIGDLHAGQLAKELKPLAKKLTRLGRGLPTGGEIEFADEETLGGALSGRG
ncbi:MAG: recombination protein RecR [Candidatus Liptonbacteria bacterium]|nr:recombination protein RecR [Candidatus Liptonbacteria bacterium]